jgi:hypothetical protein
MSKFEKSMEEIFDIIPSSVETKPVVVAEKKTASGDGSKLDQDLSDDYRIVRHNYEEIITKGKDAIDEMIKIASESEHPRAFEVVATLIKNVSEVNEKMIILQKQMREMNKGAGKESQKTTIDKAIFVGSTSELSKLLKGNKE